MSQNSAALPVVLVAGFLGSGKTTLMRGLIRDAHARKLRVGVVVNEFGVADVDSNLLAEANAELLGSIAGGCACCSGLEEFIYTLADAGVAYRDNAPDERLDALLVECSGVADPIAMLDALTVAGLLSLVRVGALVSVVDALRFPQMREGAALPTLLRRQIALSDWLILSKSDLAIKDRWLSGARQLEASVEFLRQLNPTARIERTTNGSFATDDLWSRVLAPDSALNSSHAARAQDSDIPKAQPHAHYQTLNVPVPHALKRAELEAALAALPPQVWRAKGFVRLREADGREALYVMQYVGGEMGELRGDAAQTQWKITEFDWPHSQRAKPPLTLVFIGPQLDRVALEREFGGREVIRLL